jgi:hypothetical protein
MLILLPLDGRDMEVSQLTNLDKVVAWGLVDLQDGKVQKIDFYATWEEIEAFFDCVVVADKGDYVWPFMEQSIPVLEAPIQRTIEDVIEAFLFKELYEVIN